MDKKIRRQLTLFVNREDAVNFEVVRKQFNPRQQELIDSHVTLCREDEIGDIPALLGNLERLSTPALSIDFGPVTRFENGAGVMLPALGNNEPFHRLRAQILQGISSNLRRPEPHITLMHPRNSTCTDEIFTEIQQMSFPHRLTFDTISLIEQIDGGRWQILGTYRLSGDQPINK